VKHRDPYFDAGKFSDPRMDNRRADIRSDIDSRTERDRDRRADGREPANG